MQEASALRDARPSWRVLEQGRQAAQAPSDLLTAPLKHSCARVKVGELESGAFRLAADEEAVGSSAVLRARTFEKQEPISLVEGLGPKQLQLQVPWQTIAHRELQF